MRYIIDMNERSFIIDAEGNTPSDRSPTRQRILKAARDVITRRGYRNTKVQHILKKAGLAVGTFYIYFRKKEDIMIEMIRENGFSLRDALRESFKQMQIQYETQELPPHALSVAFEMLYKTFFTFMNEHRSSFYVVFREGVLMDPRITPVAKKVFQDLTDDISERLRYGMRLGLVRKMKENELQIVSHGIFGMLIHASQKYLESESADFSLWVDRLVAFSCTGLAPDKKGQWINE